MRLLSCLVKSSLAMVYIFMSASAWAQLATDKTRSNITIDVHHVPISGVLRQLAVAANINLVVSHDLDVQVSLMLFDIDPDVGIKLMCNLPQVSCENGPDGLLVGPIAGSSEAEIMPLHSVKLQYADANDVLTSLQGASSMLSSSGQLFADTRAQQIFVYDEIGHAQKVIEAVTALDLPLKQLLIESRIVIVKSTFGSQKGLDFIGGLGPQYGGGLASDGPLNAGIRFNQLGGGFQLGLVGAHVMLSLELAALEADGQALTLSQPQILVQEGYTGSIHTGQELSYTVATDDGQQQEWKSAVLGLTVVPRVLPKNQVQLDLVVVQDSIGDLLPNGQLSLNTHKLETRAMVGLGQTLVLGGALYQQQLDRLLSNPAISGLPFVGQWFANEQTESERLELLIFVTPRIVNP